MPAAHVSVSGYEGWEPEHGRYWVPGDADPESQEVRWSCMGRWWWDEETYRWIWWEWSEDESAAWDGALDRRLDHNRPNPYYDEYRWGGPSYWRE